MFLTSCSSNEPESVASDLLVGKNWVENKDGDLSYEGEAAFRFYTATRGALGLIYDDIASCKFNTFVTFTYFFDAEKNELTITFDDDHANYDYLKLQQVTGYIRNFTDKVIKLDSRLVIQQMGDDERSFGVLFADIVDE